MTTMIRSRRSFESFSYELHPLTGRLVSTKPPPSPGAAIRPATCRCPASVRVSMVTDRLPWFNPAQYRLRPRCRGHRSMSIPPPGGSTRITSAPRAARAAPPSGAATNADSSTTRSPARIGESAGPGIVQGLGPLLLQARRQSFVDVFEDRGRARPWQLLDLSLRCLDCGLDLVERGCLLIGRPDTFADRKAPMTRPHSRCRRRPAWYAVAAATNSNPARPASSTATGSPRGDEGAERARLLVDQLPQPVAQHPSHGPHARGPPAAAASRARPPACRRIRRQRSSSPRRLTARMPTAPPSPRPALPA